MQRINHTASLLNSTTRLHVQISFHRDSSLLLYAARLHVLLTLLLVVPKSEFKKDTLWSFLVIYQTYVMCYVYILT